MVDKDILYPKNGQPKPAPTHVKLNGVSIMYIDIIWDNVTHVKSKGFSPPDIIEVFHFAPLLMEFTIFSPFEVSNLDLDNDITYSVFLVNHQNL